MENTTVQLRSLQVNDIDITSLYDSTSKNPFKTLYFAIILQAILDMTKPEEPRENSEIKLQRDQANAWFFCSVGVTCENFEDTCQLAGLEPRMVRSFALNVMTSGEVNEVRKRINNLL